MTIIDDYAFSFCNHIESVTIPESIKTIADAAFYYCINLESVTIPDSVTTIGAWAFMNCYRIKCVEIPVTVTSIGDKAFGYLEDYEKINDFIVYGTENSEAENYALRSGIIFKTAFLHGDISGNGKIDLYDAIEICKSIMGMRTFTDEEQAIADYDGNGKVDLYDAIGIAKKLLEK